MRQISNELRNSFAYSTHPFEGERDWVEFSTRVTCYSKNGRSENSALVRYELKNGRISRTERDLRQTLRRSKETDEFLFDGVKANFDYLYLDDSEELVWKNMWRNKSNIGIPRGVRISISGRELDRERTIEVLIPQGVLINAGKI